MMILIVNTKSFVKEIEMKQQEAIEIAKALMERYNKLIVEHKSFSDYEIKDMFVSVKMVANNVNVTEITMELIKDFLPRAEEMLNERVDRIDSLNKYFEGMKQDKIYTPV